MRHLCSKLALASALGVLAPLAGCGGGNETAAPPAKKAAATSKPTSQPAGKAGSKSEAASGEVTWKEVRALDELTHRADALLAKGDIAGLRAIAGDLRAAAQAVADSAVPANAKNAEQAKVLASDLASLAGALGDDPSKLSDEDLKGAATAFHPVTLALMEAAGMPHVHAKDDGHDHDDHDHEHAEDGHDHGHAH